MEFCVVITGAGGGIGKSLILDLIKKFHKGQLYFYPNYFIRDDKKISSLKIIAISRKVTEILKLSEEILSGNEKSAVSLIGIASDLNSEEGLLATIRELKKHSGPVHALINNAAEFANNPLGKMTSEDFRRIYYLNAMVPALLIQELEPRLRMEAGHIINIGSMGGVQGSVKFPGFTIYSSSKMALAGITECLATELPPNVFINYLALGSVNTGMLSKAFPDFVCEVQPETMAAYLINFLIQSPGLQNGRVVEVSLRNP